MNLFYGGMNNFNLLKKGLKNGAIYVFRALWRIYTCGISFLFVLAAENILNAASFKLASLFHCNYLCLQVTCELQFCGCFACGFFKYDARVKKLKETLKIVLQLKMQLVLT